MYFIRLVCLLFAFVPPKDTKFLTYFFNVRPLTSHSNVFFFFKCIIILPSYNVLCYASATDVTTVLLYKCMTLAGEKTEHCKRKQQKKTYVRFVFLSIRLSDLLSTVCLSNQTLGERGILGNNIVFLVLSFRGKITMMLSI